MIKPSLKLVESGSNIIDSTWRAWKPSHWFTLPSWDLLITYFGTKYYKKRLCNKAKAKNMVFGAVAHGGATYVLKIHYDQIQFFYSCWRCASEKAGLQG